MMRLFKKDMFKGGEYYVNLDYCEGIDSFNDCWNIVNCIVCYNTILVNQKSMERVVNYE